VLSTGVYKVAGATIGPTGYAALVHDDAEILGPGRQNPEKPSVRLSLEALALKAVTRALAVEAGQRYRRLLGIFPRGGGVL
jgi:hypothetical protein